jgi:tol-pal system beta propeller repeat protein TolB
MNPDGSGYQRLTTDDKSDYNYPSLAPDGKSVVYAGEETGAFQIYAMDLQSHQERQLTDKDNGAYAPAVSPDGSQIVYVMEEGENKLLWIMDRNGKHQRQVFGPPQGNGWDPTWSPDGKQILFASDMAGDVQLFVLNLQDASVRQVTHFPGIRGRSDWSPDGAWMATYAGETWQHEIVIFKPDGSGEKPITNGGNNLAPSFSPDGQWITFTSYRDHPRDDNGCEIYIMRTDGSQVTRLTNNNYCDWQPRWGP